MPNVELGGTKSPSCCGNNISCAALARGVTEEAAMTIRKVKAGYRLVSKKGKNLGTYKTKSGAEKRERQVQYFKKKK